MYEKKTSLTTQKNKFKVEAEQAEYIEMLETKIYLHSIRKILINNKTLLYSHFSLFSKNTINNTFTHIYSNITAYKTLNACF